MSDARADSDEQDAVEPRFVLKVVVLALAIYAAFGPWTYGPYAVIVFFGCWRLAARRSKESRREFSWKSVGWRVLAALALLVVSFLLGVRH
jgi:hypothetical protein